MTVNELYDYALSFYGIPYQWGGNGPGPSSYGFDCSGLVEAILSKVNLDPAGRSSAHELYLHFSKCGVPFKGIGSLAFFGESDFVEHVGWMLNDKIMISAAGGGRQVTNRVKAQCMDAYVKIQPISYYRFPSLVGCWSPIYPTV